MFLFALLACAPPCEVPEGLGPAPLVVEESLNVNRLRAFGGPGWLVHLIDMVWVGDTLVGAGSGGVWTFESGERLGLLGSWEPDRGAKLTGLAPLGDGLVAALDRSTAPVAGTDLSGFAWQGVHVVDVSDPTRPAPIAQYGAEDIVAIAAWGEDLVVLRSFGLLEVLRLEGDRLDHVMAWDGGLTTPQAVIVRDDLAYVTDAALGLVVFDLSGPGVVGMSPLRGVAGQMALGEGELVVAAGASGVEVFSLADPAHPVSMGLSAVGGDAHQVAVDGDLLWVATLDGVAALERVADGAYGPLGFYDTERFSLCVEAHPERPGEAFGCGWSDLHRLRAEPGVRAPQATFGADEILAPEGEESVWLNVANRGAAPLSFLDLAATIEGLDASTPSPLGPGEASTVLLRFLGGYSGEAGEVCLATDDPAQPVTTLPIHTGAGSSELGVGVMAPEIRLDDLEGRTHHLSSYRGKPVLVTWFATWCPICAPELIDLEESVWQRYGGDVQVLAVAADDGVEPLRRFRDELGLSFPILVDAEQAYVDDWAMRADFSDAIYPQEYLISPEGEIVYFSNSYDPEALFSRLDALLDG